MHICCVRPTINTQYYVLSWYLVKLGRFGWPTHKFPPYSALVLKVPSANNLPCHRDQTHFLLIPEEQIAIPCQPMELNRANLILLWESGGIPPSCYYKACFLHHLIAHCVLKHNPHGARHSMVSSSSGLWVYVTSRMLPISSVHCWVSCARPSPLP